MLECVCVFLVVLEVELKPYNVFYTALSKSVINVSWITIVLLSIKLNNQTAPVVRHNVLAEAEAKRDIKVT